MQDLDIKLDAGGNRNENEMNSIKQMKNLVLDSDKDASGLKKDEQSEQSYYDEEDDSDNEDNQRKPADDDDDINLEEIQKIQEQLQKEKAQLMQSSQKWGSQQFNQIDPSAPFEPAQNQQAMPFNLATALDSPIPKDDGNFGGDISSIIIDPNAIDGEEEEDEGNPVIGEPATYGVNDVNNSNEYE